MSFWVVDGQLSVVECLLRIIIAGLCGAMIGSERSKRQKEAGLRTHMIVAIGSALIMIVSKYGFTDIPAIESMKVDASRIASNVVTGVSFLGAGVIFLRGGAVSGLTTAAGIWATAAVGMCTGSGLYIVGVCTTLIILVIQLMLHHWMPLSENMSTREISIKMANDGDSIKSVVEYLNENNLTVLETKISKDEDKIVADLTVRTLKGESISQIVSLIHEIPGIDAIEV